MREERRGRPASRTPWTRPLPGELPSAASVERMIRVDHAGEFGARRIYEGQLAVLGRSESAPLLRHMAEQERVHLETFERLMVERRVRPSALHPLWHVAGFVLGAGTALMGERAAMACTVAVEEVIDTHYERRHSQLGADEEALKDTIARFREEELEHRDMALQNEAEQAAGYTALTTVIKAGSRAAIWLAERF